jgi:hypothetical protein
MKRYPRPGCKGLRGIATTERHRDERREYSVRENQSGTLGAEYNTFIAPSSDPCCARATFSRKRTAVRGKFLCNVGESLRMLSQPLVGVDPVLFAMRPRWMRKEEHRLESKRRKIQPMRVFRRPVCNRKTFPGHSCASGRRVSAPRPSPVYGRRWPSHREGRMRVVIEPKRGPRPQAENYHG